MKANMSGSVRISVIIPVHNAAAYVDECLESIRSQSFREIEVICVDDASTDSSLVLLRKHADADKRVHVIETEKNMGRSGARNTGLKHARGEYVLFVDADDFLEPGVLEKLNDEVVRHDADRAGCPFKYIYEGQPDRRDCFIPEDVSDKELGCICCNAETIGRVHHGTGGMMLRRSILEEHGIRFPAGVVCEDLYVHYVSFPHCRRAVVIQSPYYVYRKHDASITSAFSSGVSREALDYLTVARLVLEDWKRSGVLEEYRTAFLKMLVMCVRNIRKYAPHAVQGDVTRTVCRLLRDEHLYRPEEDGAGLSQRESKLLKTWAAGKSGMDFSYYWKKMRKAAVRLFRR